MNTSIQVTKQLDVSLIRTDGGTQPRTEINYDVVREYAQDMMLGVSFPPVIIFYDGTDYWLGDGFHRYYAAKQICREAIDADIREGTRRDAVLYSVGTNATHGLRRSNADKRKAAETLLKDEEWAAWSDREIARRCGVDNAFVSKLRKFSSVDRQQIESLPRLVERNGSTYAMNTSNIGRPQQAQDNYVPMPFVQSSSEENNLFNAQWTNTITKEEDDDEGREETETTNLTLPPQQREEAVKLVYKGVPAALLTSDTCEWFTPPQYVDMARELLGGIDLDPASNAYANEKVVQAAAFYDIETNGLNKDWHGRVWLNPPYGKDGGDSNQEIWSRRLIEQFEAGSTTEAVLLVNANTEAKWFQPLYNYFICFTNHRIRFYNTEGTPSQPTQGNAFIYFGSQQERFVKLFSSFGVVIRRIDK